MTSNEPGQPSIAEVAAWTRDLDVPSSALAIGAHPDDVEFGCGATLAKWAAAGCTIHHLVCTDGSKGTWDALADPVALAARRQDEQRAAARQLAGPAAGEVRFLGYVDGELDPGDHSAVEVIGQLLDEVQPDTILTFGPDGMTFHPDHIAVHRWVTYRRPNVWRGPRGRSRISSPSFSQRQLTSVTRRPPASRVIFGDVLPSWRCTRKYSNLLLANTTHQAN
jgi:LmbE family N-acetylglucosaminyl deacetylase